MRIESLVLRQFRNYQELSLSFPESNVQLFVGPNGSGKTNIIEAMSLLSLGKSCRGRDEEDMVHWGADFYRVQATLRSDVGEQIRLEVVSELMPRRRAFFKNDVRIQLSDSVGALPGVVFLPQELMLFSGPPAERRAFLDRLLSQISPEYLMHSVAYHKVLQQRNALLRRIAEGQDGGGIEVWEHELASHGSKLTALRLEVLQTMNMSLMSEVQHFGETWQNGELIYTRKTQGTDAATIERELRDLLENHRDRDVILQSTTVGPHREDWSLHIEGRDLPTFASRGQERTAVLALLLLEVSFLELKRNEKPVIMLDDAFSELDDRHQHALLQAFERYQVILTATRVPPGVENAKVWDVENGTVQ